MYGRISTAVFRLMSHKSWTLKITPRQREAPLIQGATVANVSIDRCLSFLFFVKKNQAIITDGGSGLS
jgi:hypothetical protein